jgi:anti-sigma factor ChrR (cupin superfamily)
MTAINGDLSKRVAVDTASMDWSPSPSGSVWRKRVHLVGPPETGQVTSIVRYEPDSMFHAHDHPDGEEILVLDGVFSDEHGDWSAGTYLLNPEGFRHAPFSKPGCILFVKLRQFAGRDRRHVVIDTKALDWEAATPDGIARKLLYRQDGFADEVQLERWPRNLDALERDYPAGAELLVLDGRFSDETGTFGTGCWLRFPAGARHHPRTADSCTLYVERGGLAYLKTSAS